jgi:prevent-host-death family protein
MTHASITETKRTFSALLDRVREGETVTITDRGVPVARLVPAVGSAGDDEGRILRLERAGLVRRGPRYGEPLAELLEPGPRAQESVLEALLEERRESER